MRNYLWVRLTVLLAICAADVRADTFTATFTCTGTCLSVPTAVPNVSFPSPTLNTTWDTLQFSFLLLAVDLSTDDFSWNVTLLPISSGTEAMFRISDLTQGNFQIDSKEIPGNCPSCTPATFDAGELKFAAAAAPEPSSVVLTLVGIGLVFAMRKRWASGLRQTS
jgi:hypothetical protein